MNDKKLKEPYGMEVILDLHECDVSKFTRKSIKKFLVDLCNEIDMQRCKLCWWDDLNIPIEERDTEPHLVGTSACQFISTSNIVIHTLDIMKSVYLNIFSCKDFDPELVRSFCRDYFSGRVVNYKIIRRL